MSPVSAEIFGITFPQTHESPINGIRVGSSLAVLLKDDPDGGGRVIIARKKEGSTNPKDFDVLKTYQLKPGESKFLRTNIIDPGTKELLTTNIKLRGE